MKTKISLYFERFLLQFFSSRVEDGPRFIPNYNKKLNEKYLFRVEGGHQQQHEDNHHQKQV